ncbi:MAG TPA: GNAT family N-acetyltransferase [Anaerolineae bacterium]|nr:GNAT family N-acetyltransferase [Anaerolineae bacterium]
MLAQLETTDVLDYGLPFGYTLHGATLDDLPEAVAMFNAASRQLTGKDEFEVKAYRTEWTVPALNLPEYVKVVRAADGQLVGCVEVWDLFDPHTRVNTWIKVHPEHQRHGVEAALMRFAEDKARHAALTRAPQGTRVSMMSWVNSVDAATNDAYAQAGFNVVRHSYHMHIELTEAPPAPVWPAGITLRPFVAERDLRAVAETDRDAFRDHWGFVERSLDDDVHMLGHWLQSPYNDPALWLVAMDGERVAGISLNQSQSDEDPDMGWVGSLGVRREYRHKGLATALLQHSFGEFYRRGKKRVGLGVDAYNLTGALRLYECVGMHVARKYNTQEKELRGGVELSTQQLK